MPARARPKSAVPGWAPSILTKRRANSAAQKLPMVETAALGDIVEAAGGAAASVLPGVLADVVRTLSVDAGDLVNLQPSVVGLVRLGVCSAFFKC
jgi:hypothetical protein